MPIVSFFRSTARAWRTLFAGLLAPVAAVLAQSPSAADGFDPNVNGNVYAIALQADGKLLLAGSFSLVSPNGSSISYSRNNLARLNTDGTLDAAFDPNTNGPVRTLALQADGKILVGGAFTTLQPNGATAATTRNAIARLNADGSLDSTFDPNAGGLAPTVYAISLQPNGSMFVGGSFSSLQPNGAAAPTTRNNLARLNADGSLDAAYNPNPNRLVFAIAPHINNKLIIAGGFTSLAPNGGAATTRNGAARLNPDGSVDSEFDPNLNNRATALTIQRDGKVLIGGDFSTIHPIGSANPISRNRLVRLNTDGTLDTGFTANASGNIATIAVQSDGFILIGGAFTTVWSAGTNVNTRAFLARYTPAGEVDLTFSANVNQIVDAIAFQPDGKVIIAGYFTGFQPVGSASSILRNRVARLNGNGTVDTTFNPDVGGRPLVELAQADGKIVIGGSFTSVGGATHNRLARLNSDGTVDTTFNPDFNGLVLTMALQPADQKILVGGTFTTVGGETRNYIARLNPSGSIDSQFNPNANGQIASILLQSDGKILVGGAFTTLQPLGLTSSKTVSHIARLNSDGSLDTAFHPNASSTVETMALQPDGKILLGGAFTAFLPGTDLTPTTTTNKDGTTTTTTPTGTSTGRNYFARINTDGSLDTNFNPNPNNTVAAIAVQSDGKIVIGGSFTALRPNGTSDAPTKRNFLARVNADGTLDTKFDPNANNVVFCLGLQANGQILVGGPFTTLTPNLPANTTGPFTLRKYAARLNTDGTVDSAFNLDLNELGGNRVDSWRVLANGQILVGGNFTSLQPIGAPSRVSRNHFARLNADGTLDNAFVPGVGGASGGLISALVVQPDGKLIAAGNFTGLGGTTTKNIARFNPEGTADTTFTTTLAADGPINSVLIRPTATTVTTQSKGLAWVEGNGNLRTSFAPGPDSIITGTVESFAVQSDGSVVVGGTFTTPTGVPGPNLVRFTSKGALDPNFGPGPNGAVKAIVLQPDGRIIVGGTFTTIASSDRSYVARLNQDGTIDPGFDPHAGAAVSAIALQSDGNIIIGGAFTTVNPNLATTTTTTTANSTSSSSNSTTTKANSGGGNTTTTVTVSGTTVTTTVVSTNQDPTNVNYVARLTSAGKLDKNYTPWPDSTVNAIVVQADGKAVIGGQYTGVRNGSAGTAFTRFHLARLNTDGTVDTGYDPNANDAVNALAIFADGKVIAGGNFTSIGFGNRNYIARLNTDGTLDSNFDPFASGPVKAIAVQPDTKILFGGDFTSVKPNGATNAVARNGVARVNFAGDLDTGFDPNANGTVNALIANSDGSVLLGGAFTSLRPTPPIIVGGSFATIGGVASRNLALLGDDGTVSTIFQANPNGAINAMLIQADGKFVLGGAFTSIAGVARSGLARFNADFSLDTTFTPSVVGAVNSLALQSDGKLLVATGTAILRFNTNGTADASFVQTGAGSRRNFRALAVRGDGRILYLASNGAATPLDVLERLTTAGSLDPTFQTLTSLPNSLQTLTLQSDTSIIVGGKNMTVGQLSSVRQLVRLSPDGVLDVSYDPAPDGAVTALVLQTDGRLVIGGNFANVGGLPRGGLARLAASTGATQAITASPNGTSVVWARGGASPELSSVTFDSSNDGSNWTPIGIGGRVSGTANWQLNGLSLPTSGLFYVRARGITPSAAGTSSGVVEAARQFNPGAIPGIGPFANTVAALEIGGVLVDSATGLITGQMPTGSTGTSALSSAPIGLVAQAIAATNPGALGDARLVNFSARSVVGGGNGLINGFAISGSQPHSVLLRAVGPGLSQFGVNGVLATPSLQLYDGSGSPLLANQGWSTASDMVALQSAAARSGAFPLLASSSDAAVVVTLAPGAYSVQTLDAAGAADPGGVALAEVYDADVGNSSSRLANLSLRGTVNPGSGTFINGFVLSGNVPKTVLIRGSGPALAKFAVSNALADPILSVFESGGQLIASNDNWSQPAAGAATANTSALISAAATVGAFAFDAGSKDSAVLLTLVPGTYTVQVTGANSGTGTALIEVYLLP